FVRWRTYREWLVPPTWSGTALTDTLQTHLHPSGNAAGRPTLVPQSCRAFDALPGCRPDRSAHDLGFAEIRFRKSTPTSALVLVGGTFSAEHRKWAPTAIGRRPSSGVDAPGNGATTDSAICLHQPYIAPACVAQPEGHAAHLDEARADCLDRPAQEPHN